MIKARLAFAPAAAGVSPTKPVVPSSNTNGTDSLAATTRAFEILFIARSGAKSGISRGAVRSSVLS